MADSESNSVTTTVSTVLGPVSYTYSDNLENNVFVVLDNSGSMSGSRIEMAKNVIRELKKKTEINHFIVFGTEAYFVDISTLDGVTGNGGGTCFWHAFSLVGSNLKGGVNVVVLVTDGETTPYDVHYSIEVLKAGKGDDPSIEVQVHSIGIHASGDLLFQLAQFDVPGTVLNIERYKSGLSTDEAIQEYTDTIAALINSGVSFKIVEGGDEGVRVMDISSMDENMQVVLFTALMQKACKLYDPGALATEAQKLETLLASMELESSVRGDLRKKVNGLWQIAKENLGESQRAKKLSELLFAVQDSGNLASRLNKCIIMNADKAALLLEQNKILKPYEFTGVWKENEYSCILSGLSPEEAHAENDIFCLAGWTKVKPHGIVAPEILKVEVQPVYLTWEWYKKSVDFADPVRREEGVIANLDNIRVNCLIPLLPNQNGMRLLQICSAIWSNGDERALSMAAARALPVLALIDIYTRKKTRWLEEARLLVEPMCRFVHPKNFSNTVKNFETNPVARISDVIPSLSVFLMRCIIAEYQISDELVSKIFTEAVRRWMTQNTQEWHVPNLWTTSHATEATKEEDNTASLIRVVKKNWMEGIPTHGVKIGSSSTMSLHTKPNAEFIRGKIQEIRNKWQQQANNKILLRNCEEKNLTLKDPMGELVDENCPIMQQLKFLAAAKLTAMDIRTETKPQFTPIVDSNMTKIARFHNSTAGWEQFSKEEDINNAAAILATMNEYEVAVFRKLLKDPVNCNIPLWKLKQGLVWSNWNWMLKVPSKEDPEEFEFVEVKSKPVKRVKEVKK